MFIPWWWQGPVYCLTFVNALLMPSRQECCFKGNEKVTITFLPERSAQVLPFPGRRRA